MMNGGNPADVQAASESSQIPSDEPRIKSFERFFKKPYVKPSVEEALGRASLEVEGSRSLIVSMWDLDKHDQSLAEFAVTRPIEAIAIAEEALKLVADPNTTAGEPRIRLHVRFSMRTRETPDGPLTVQPFSIAATTLPRLGSRTLGRLVTFRASVRKVTERIPTVKEAVYKCKLCGVLIREPQDEHLILREPVECYENQGGCGRESKFKLIVGAGIGATTLTVDRQRVVLQQLPEETEQGIQVEDVTAYLEDDIVAALKPGDRIRITGIHQTAIKTKGNVKTTELSRYIDIVNIDREDDLDTSILATPDDIALFNEAAKATDFHERVVTSIARPAGIAGQQSALLALLLSVIGPNRVKGKKNQIHVCLIGDPSTAKTLIARSVMTLAERHVMSTGGASTKAGMTVGAVKDDDGKWSLEGGAFIQAIRGVLVIDEAQLMEDHEKQSLNEGMEYSTISKTIAGITATYHDVDSTVWMLLNPKGMKFNKDESLFEQFDIPANTLSRFDAIFVLLDRSSPENDSIMARAMLQQRYGLVAAPTEPQEPLLFEPLQLRKFVRYARERTVQVRPDVLDTLVTKFVDFRMHAKAKPGTDDEKRRVLQDISPRHFTSILRLSEAYAKLSLHDYVEQLDVEKAITLFESWTQSSIGELEVANSGAPGDIVDAQGAIIEVVRRLSAGSDEGAHLPEIQAALPQYSPTRVERVVKHLSNYGRLIKTWRDGYKVT